MKLLLVSTALVFPIVFLQVDRYCVKGRLSPEQADLIGTFDWAKKNKRWSSVDENDRVIAKECSELGRYLTLRKPVLMVEDGIKWVWRKF